MHMIYDAVILLMIYILEMHVCIRINVRKCLEQHCSQWPKLEKSPTDKLWCVHKRILYSNENKSILSTCKKIDESYKYTAEKRIKTWNNAYSMIQNQLCCFKLKGHNSVLPWVESLLTTIALHPPHSFAVYCKLFSNIYNLCMPSLSDGFLFNCQNCGTFSLEMLLLLIVFSKVSHETISHHVCSHRCGIPLS